MKHVFIQLVNNALAGVISQCFKGEFHLHLSVFPFVYQFNSRIGVLVKDFQGVIEEKGNLCPQGFIGV